MIALTVRNIRKSLKDPDRAFDLHIPAFMAKGGEKIAVVGTTGSGKTTAMDILAMASQPSVCEQFELSVDGKTHDLNAASKNRRKSARLRASYFGYVMQKSPLFPFLSVRENTLLQQRISTRPDAAFVDQLFKRLGIGMIADAMSDEISVGQKQRTAIARSLAHRPSIILCDEPTGALDPRTARDCIETIIWAAERTGAILIMITHDWDLAKAYGFDFYEIKTRMLADNAMSATLARQSGAEKSRS